MRVALAEDDDDQRLALEIALQGEGFEVLSFEDGSELLDFFQMEGAPTTDVIVSDVNMPGHSGLDGLELARAQGLNVPIFVVTGETSPALLERVARLGNALCLKKPLDAEGLAQAIHRVAALQSVKS